jgi:hypothetical protein
MAGGSTSSEIRAAAEQFATMHLEFYPACTQSAGSRRQAGGGKVRRATGLDRTTRFDGRWSPAGAATSEAVSLSRVAAPSTRGWTGWEREIAASHHVGLASCCSSHLDLQDQLYKAKRMPPCATGHGCPLPVPRDTAILQVAL